MKSVITPYFFCRCPRAKALNVWTDRRSTEKNRQMSGLDSVCEKKKKAIRNKAKNIFDNPDIRDNLSNIQSGVRI